MILVISWQNNITMRSLYNRAIINIILPLADKAMKTSVAASYKELRRLHHYTPNEITAWQSERLKSLIQHTYRHSAYYYNLFTERGLSPDDINSVEDLKKLPVLTKELVIKYFDSVVADNVGRIPYKKSATGGSTGDPMKYLLDHQSWSMSNANTILNWERAGYRYGDPFIALGSTSLFVNKSPSIKHRVYYGLKNKIGLNGINMSDEVCKDYIAIIKKRKIRFIYGYASSIYLLAKYLLKCKEEFNIKACFTTSEVLTYHFRETIHKAFQCDILDCYGAHDGGITAFSYEKGFFEVGYSCLLRIDDPDKNGQGPALLTDLFNYAMPLINYRLGDEILIDKSSNNAYPYNGQIINKVFGRTSDIIELENKRTITGPGFTILFKDLPVEHYCIEKTGINAIKCQIVKLPDYTKQHENLIRSTFIKQLGGNTQFSIEYTREIPLSKSGKRQYFRTT